MPDPSNNPRWNQPTRIQRPNKGYDQYSYSGQDGNVIQSTRAYNSSYYLDDNGQMWAGGYNNNKQLGVGHATTEYRVVPVQFPGTAGRIIYYAPSGYGSTNQMVLALDASGKVWGWGYNGHNQVTSSQHQLKVFL